MSLFGCRELINIGGDFVATARNHVARLEYGYGTVFFSKTAETGDIDSSE